MNPITRRLDRCYRACGYLAGLCIVAMLVIILLQIVMRWLSLPFPGATSYAGYLMGSSTFFALAWTFHEEGHIRVGLLVERAGRWRPWCECWCLTAALATVSFITWNAADATLWSWRFGDVSSAQDATPLWIPQLVLTAGAAVFALCLFDHLCRQLNRDVLGTSTAGGQDGRT